jgi:hypothetical protein
LLQYFCGLGEVDGVKIPSKSALQRYDVWWNETEVRQVIHQLLRLGATAPQQLHLPEAIDLESAFLDVAFLAFPVNFFQMISWETGKPYRNAVW